MHVLFVIDTWGLIGGTERHAAVAVPALLERGHRVTVLCREDQQPGFAEVEVIAFEALEGTGLARWDRRALASRLAEASPDVVFHSACRNVDASEVLIDTAPVVRFVHDHTLFCPGLNKMTEEGDTCREPMGFACFRRYYLQSGCICFKPAGHASRWTDPARAMLERWRELGVARRSTRVLTNSRYMRGQLLEVGFGDEQTSVLYIFTRSNTPDQPRAALDAETERFLAAGDAPLLFTPARLTLPDKGVDYLLTSLAAVRSPFRAVVAGTGPAEEWLRTKAAEEGVADRVHFTGWMPSGAIEELYARASVVVCPSVWDEPFGLVGIEAMAHSKPVVAFDVGGIPEWLDDGETGHLVPRKDTAAMASAIDGLLGDEGLRRRFGARGTQVVQERFGRRQHLDGLERALLAAAGMT